MANSISVIIPAYNEELYLSRIIKSKHTARANFTGGCVEIIVADNSSTDGIARLAASLGANVVTIEKRRIAAARNGGAAAAMGEVLCFIDADSALHPERRTSLR